MRRVVDQNIAQIATRFVDARRSASVLTDYPGITPVDLSDAYAIQDSAIALIAGEIVGWKVGRINPPIGDVDRLAGPIYTCVNAASTVRTAEILAALAIEDGARGKRGRALIALHQAMLVNGRMRIDEIARRAQA